LEVALHSAILPLPRDGNDEHFVLRDARPLCFMFFPMIPRGSFLGITRKNDLKNKKPKFMVHYAGNTLGWILISGTPWSLGNGNRQNKVITIGIYSKLVPSLHMRNLSITCTNK